MSSDVRACSGQASHRISGVLVFLVSGAPTWQEEEDHPNLARASQLAFEVQEPEIKGNIFLDSVFVLICYKA